LSFLKLFLFSEHVFFVFSVFLFPIAKAVGLL